MASTSSCFALLCASIFSCVSARLGGGNSTAFLAQQRAPIANESSLTTSQNVSQELLDLTAAAATLAQAGGYEFTASATRYGDSPASACGALDTASIVAGTGYYQVASAQSMQGGSCCWCGKASSANGHSTGTAAMGCMQCAKGRFIGAGGAFASKEINVVVADLCPHTGNERWCPAEPGQTNAVGSKNHFDFSHPPPGIDNNYFAFTPTECSDELKARMQAMSKC